MRRFIVSATVTVSAFTYVDAETPEHAVRIARERQAVLGAERHGNSPEEFFIIEEADGMPADLRAEPA